jgi:hypothetical protein
LQNLDRHPIVGIRQTTEHHRAPARVKPQSVGGRTPITQPTAFDLSFAVAVAWLAAEVQAFNLK